MGLFVASFALYPKCQMEYSRNEDEYTTKPAVTPTRDAGRRQKRETLGRDAGSRSLPPESGEEGTSRTELGEKEMKGGRRQAVVRTDAIRRAREEEGEIG